MLHLEIAGVFLHGVSKGDETFKGTSTGELAMERRELTGTEAGLLTIFSKVSRNSAIPFNAAMAKLGAISNQSKKNY